LYSAQGTQGKAVDRPRQATGVAIPLIFTETQLFLPRQYTFLFNPRGGGGGLQTILEDPNRLILL